jgi:hypothetical protein
MVPYCFKKHSRLRYKKVTVGDGCSMATLHLPLQQLASSGRLCIIFFFSSFTPSLAGPSEELEWHFLDGRDNLRPVRTGCERCLNDTNKCDQTNLADICIRLQLMRHCFRKLCVSRGRICCEGWCPRCMYLHFI